MTTTHETGSGAAGSQDAAAIRIRPIEDRDAEAAAQIVFEAFGGIHDHHRFARDFQTIEAARQLTGAFIAHPSIWGVVLEDEGGIIGSNFLDERGPIRGVGPITVAPTAQGRGAGRRLMEAVVQRGGEARGIRLLQDAFNTRSLSLYASLGFEVREPIALMGGRPRIAPPVGLEVRPLDVADVEECEGLHRRVHGYERTAELLDALASPALQPFVAVRDGRIVAYAAGVTFFPASHGVAETEEDLFALVAGALQAVDAPASFLLPTRQGRIFRACLAAGLQVIKPMTYMTRGEHRHPAGAWFPSVLY